MIEERTTREPTDDFCTASGLGYFCISWWSMVTYIKIQLGHRFTQNRE